MKVPYLNLKIINKTIFKSYQTEFLREVKRGNYILNKDILKFEKKFANFNESKYCVSVNSGHDALKIALLALGIKKNDKVIVPAQTFISTYFAVTEIGAKVIPVDVDIETGLLSNKKLLLEISKNKIKCVIFVHLFGNICDILSVKKILTKRKISILEDCSQSHGGCYNLKKSGNFGRAGTFSFYPGKNLGGIGDGGAIITNSKKISEYAIRLRNYGSIKKYFHNDLGFNSRINSINSKFLYFKIDLLEDEIKNRDRQIKLYKKIFSNNNVILKYMKINKNVKTSNHIFYIRVKQRDKLQKYLKKNNIETLIHYPIIPPLQKYYKKQFNRHPSRYRNAKKLSEEALSLPIGSHLKNKHIYFVANNICRFFGGK